MMCLSHTDRLSEPLESNRQGGCGIQWTKLKGRVLSRFPLHDKVGGRNDAAQQEWVGLLTTRK